MKKARWSNLTLVLGIVSASPLVALADDPTYWSQVEEVEAFVSKNECFFKGCQASSVEAVQELFDGHSLFLGAQQKRDLARVFDTTVPKQPRLTRLDWLEYNGRTIAKLKGRQGYLGTSLLKNQQSKQMTYVEAEKFVKTVLMKRKQVIYLKFIFFEKAQTSKKGSNAWSKPVWDGLNQILNQILSLRMAHAQSPEASDCLNPAANSVTKNANAGLSIAAESARYDHSQFSACREVTEAGLAIRPQLHLASLSVPQRDSFKQTTHDFLMSVSHHALAENSANRNALLQLKECLKDTSPSESCKDEKEFLRHDLREIVSGAKSFLSIARRESCIGSGKNLASCSLRDPEGGRSKAWEPLSEKEMRLTNEILRAEQKQAEEDLSSEPLSQVATNRREHAKNIVQQRALNTYRVLVSNIPLLNSLTDSDYSESELQSALDESLKAGEREAKSLNLIREQMNSTNRRCTSKVGLFTFSQDSTGKSVCESDLQLMQYRTIVNSMLNGVLPVQTSRAVSHLSKATDYCGIADTLLLIDQHRNTQEDLVVVAASVPAMFAGPWGLVGSAALEAGMAWGSSERLAPAKELAKDSLNSRPYTLTARQARDASLGTRDESESEPALATSTQQDQPENKPKISFTNTMGAEALAEIEAARRARREAGLLSLMGLRAGKSALQGALRYSRFKRLDK